VAGPRLEQRAVDRERLVGQELVLVGQAEHLLEERFGDVPVQQPVAKRIACRSSGPRMAALAGRVSPNY